MGWKLALGLGDDIYAGEFTKLQRMQIATDCFRRTDEAGYVWNSATELGFSLQPQCNYSASSGQGWQRSGCVRWIT